MRIPLACCLLSCVLAVDLFYFSSLPSLLSISILDIVCFILSFSCGYYAVSSVSLSAGTLLTYDIYTYLDTCARLSHLHFCLRYTICFSYCMYHLVFLFVFLLR